MIYLDNKYGNVTIYMQYMWSITQTELLLNDENAPDGRFYSLYQVLILTARTYTESVLNDGSAPEGHFYSIYRILTLTVRPT